MSDKYLCPFCASSDLIPNFWHLDIADEEVPALECNNCLAGAPTEAFEKYATRALESVTQSKPIDVEDWNGTVKQ